MARFRIFKSSTELSYVGGSLKKTNDTFSDVGKVVFAPESSITENSIIEFRKTDGTTVKWAGRVEKLEKPIPWSMDILTFGHELKGVWIDKVYSSASPESIVQDVVDNFTAGLTFASTSASGFILTQYIAKDYGMNIIKELMDLLEWGLRIDQNGNIYFEPKNYTNNGRVLTVGSNFSPTEWVTKDKSDISNRIEVEAGFFNKAHEETVSDTGTTFVLAYKPEGTVIAKVSGSPVGISNVDAEAKTVTLSSSQTNPVFFYSYNEPIRVIHQDDDSVNDHYQRYRKIIAPWITTREDARKLAQKSVETWAEYRFATKGVYPGIHQDFDVNEEVHLVDSFRNEEYDVVIEEILWDFDDGTTVLSLGQKALTLQDWQLNVERRIKNLEQKYTNQTTVYEARNIKQNVKIEVSTSYTWKYNSPANSFMLGHVTLGWLRDSRNREIDCSGNEKHGLWTGATIDGAQYDTSGARLSCGVIPANATYLVGAAPFPSDRLTATLHFWFWGDDYALKRYLVDQPFGDTDSEIYYDPSGTKLVIKYNISGVGVQTIEIPNFNTSYAVGQWHEFFFQYINTGVEIYINDLNTPVATNNHGSTGNLLVGSNNPIIGANATIANFWSGKIDEYVVMSGFLGVEGRTTLYNKTAYDWDSTLYPNFKCWYSFDNPLLGDRSTTKVNVP